MASESQVKYFGVPLSMAVGLVGLVLALLFVGLLWKGQLDSLGKEGKGLGVEGGSPTKIIDRTKVTATVVKLRQVGGQLTSWQLDHGGYPPEVGLARNGMGNPPDGWGAPMEYAPNKPKGKDEDGVQLFGAYRIVSRGQDGLAGTDDDIVFENGLVVSGMMGEGTERPRGGGPSDEARAAAGDGGMVDPLGNSSVAPAGMRALDAARDAAAGSRQRGDAGAGE